MALKDTDLMPWGKHKGVKMANVPASYLLWLLESGNLSGGVVRDYIQENKETLQFERLNNDKK